MEPRSFSDKKIAGRDRGRGARQNSSMAGASRRAAPPGRARLRRAVTRFPRKKSGLDGVSPYRRGLNSYEFCPAPEEKQRPGISSRPLAVFNLWPDAGVAGILVQPITLWIGEFQLVEGVAGACGNGHGHLVISIDDGWRGRHGRIGSIDGRAGFQHISA